MKRRTRTRRRQPQGFTLLEVLLVLAILVILGSTVGYYIVGMQKKGYAKSAMTQINAIEGMLNAYLIDMGSYPTSLSALRVPPTDVANPQRWGGPYAQKDIPPDPWGNQYQYELLGADQFKIWSMGADATTGTEDDIVSTSG